jgi:signal transduction histidine kinase
MAPLALPRVSLLRTFAVLSLVTIALITAAQVTVQWLLLRDDLLQWERVATAEEVRAEAHARLRPEDFRQWQTPEARARFAAFLRDALHNPEILRVKLYDRDMRVVWSDEPRLLGTRFPDHAALREALQGRTIAHLERARKAENVFERSFGQTIELYVPLTFPAGAAPGAGAVAGVVEVYKDPARMFGNMVRDRLTIVATSLAGAALLWTGLFWIVRRASRQLETQRRDLERQTQALQAANDELRATQRQLGAAERLAAIGEVSATVAHGIRNPLANIRAAAQVALEATADPPVVTRHLASITAEVDRLGRWLRALLDAARPFELQRGPADLDAVVEQALGALAARVSEGRIRLTRRLAPDLPKLLADEVQLQQAVLSVLENAVEALPPGGTLEVATARGGAPGTVEVTVRDDGAGIPAERLARVFEPFFTTKGRGTGLGLAIARKVVEGHGGTIAIDSRPGAGTRVTMVLPVEAREP